MYGFINGCMSGFQDSFGESRVGELAISNKRGFSYFYFITLVFRLFLRKSDTCYLWKTIGHSWYILIIYWGSFPARNMRDSLYTFIRCLVGKKGDTCDVSGCLYCALSWFHHLIDL